METMTVGMLATALTALALIGGGYLLVRHKGRLRAAAASFLHFRCPGCKRRLRFLARQAGHRGECSHCGRELVFPRAEQSID
jgi:ribosomal protein S27E